MYFHLDISTSKINGASLYLNQGAFIFFWRTQIEIKINFATPNRPKDNANIVTLYF